MPRPGNRPPSDLRARGRKHRVRGLRERRTSNPPRPSLYRRRRPGLRPPGSAKPAQPRSAANR
ncbi:hypothetical protein P7K49_023861, partial [Saguinus oedipus]